jgi:hypothetical protein
MQQREAFASEARKRRALRGFVSVETTLDKSPLDLLMRHEANMH